MQRRLGAIGFIHSDTPGEFGDSTRAAVIAFQRSRGLSVDGSCGPNTWASLIESDFSLGDRLLCLRSPMLRGDDIGDLQLRLGVLGFDPGRVDGIFGHMTQEAVGEFQRNAGLVSDSVCGPDTVAALLRLEGRGGRSSVTGLREREHLRRRVSTLARLRIAIGAKDQTSPIVSKIASALQSAGSTVLLLEGLDWSSQATQANSFRADVFIGFMIFEDQRIAEASYYAIPGYESFGGKLLAEMIISELPASPGWSVGSIAGMRRTVLRETRPPAVLIHLGDSESLESSEDLVIASFQIALERWLAHFSEMVQSPA